MQHTPGPWTHEPYAYQQGALDQALIRDGAENQVAISTEANARLIAAAPELLEALQFALEIFEAEPVDVAPESIEEIIDQARAAINKALGTE